MSNIYQQQPRQFAVPIQNTYGQQLLVHGIQAATTASTIQVWPLLSTFLITPISLKLRIVFPLFYGDGFGSTRKAKPRTCQMTIFSIDDTPNTVILFTVVSYQNESFSSKWELPSLLSPSFITQGRMEARKAILILMKISHFDRTPLYRCTPANLCTIFQVDQVSITACHEYWAVVGCEMYLKFVILSSAAACGHCLRWWFPIDFCGKPILPLCKKGTLWQLDCLQ